MEDVSDVIIRHRIIEPAIERIDPTHVVDTFRPSVIRYNREPMAEAFFGAELKGVVVSVVAGFDDAHVAEILVRAALLNVGERRIARHIDGGVGRTVGTGSVAIKVSTLISEVTDAG